MRRAVIAMLLVACGDRVPSAPDPAKYEAMDEDQRCKAAEPRAVLCTEELMVADLDELAGTGGLPPETVGAIKDGLTKGPTTADEARAIHKTSCLGSPGTEYQDAIVACWKTAGCAELVACMKTKRGKRRDHQPQ
jgi:hypothetical protein